jgi:hypothetical protein
MDNMGFGGRQMEAKLWSFAFHTKRNSISRVMPLQDHASELEFFTMSLRMVSHSDEIEIDI